MPSVAIRSLKAILPGLILVGVLEMAPAAAAGDRIENATLGCSVELPETGQAAIAGGDDAAFIRMVERETSPPSWEIVIRELRLPVPEGTFGEPTAPPSPKLMMEAYLEDAQAVNDALEVNEQTSEIRLAELPAARASANFEHSSGRTARYDWTFIQTGPRRFLLVQYLGDRDRWPADIFEGVTESIEIRTEAEIAARTLTVVERGSAIIARFDQPTFRTLVDRMDGGLWYRLHGVGRNGSEDRELGYARLAVLETLEEAVRKPGPPVETTIGETGMLVWIQIRILPSREGGPYRDVDHRAWLSWDREAELWLLRESDRIRDSKATRSTSIFGIRPRPTAQDPRRWLQVVSQSRETFERGEIKIEVPSNLDQYLSEAERLVLPSLLAIVKPLPGEFGVYAWNEEREALTRRVEDWDPEGGPGDDGQLLSRPSRIARPAIQQLDAGGFLSKRVTPTDGAGGTFEWDLIDGAELRAVYLRKGIPFEG